MSDNNETMAKPLTEDNKYRVMPYDRNCTIPLPNPFLPDGAEYDKEVDRFWKAYDEVNSAK